MNDNWIIEHKYHEHDKPNQWKYYNYSIHCETPLKELLSDNIKKDGIPLYLPGGECYKKGEIKKNYRTKCGKHIKKKTDEVERITMTDKKIVIRTKSKWSNSITEETYYNVPASACTKAQKLENTLKKVSLWETNELSNWFGWGKKANFPKAKNLTKKMKDKIRACNKLLPKNKIGFPQDHICHKTLLDAEDLSNIYCIKEYAKIIDIVTDSTKVKLVDKKNRDINLKNEIKKIEKYMKRRDKKKWKTGVPIYET